MPLGSQLAISSCFGYCVVMFYFLNKSACIRTEQCAISDLSLQFFGYFQKIQNNVWSLHYSSLSVKVADRWRLGSSTWTKRSLLTVESETSLHVNLWLWFVTLSHHSGPAESLPDIWFKQIKVIQLEENYREIKEIKL